MWCSVHQSVSLVKSEKREVMMSLLPEELQNYGNTGLSAMADLMDQVLDGCAPNYDLPGDFLEAMEALREEISLAIEDNLMAMEEQEMKWLAQAPVLERGEDHAHH
jgi:hypothetical protein